MFEQANEILGFRITDLMFTGTGWRSQTNTRHTAIDFSAFSDSCKNHGKWFPSRYGSRTFLGEFSSLVAKPCVTFVDGLKLVKVCIRHAKAREKQPSTMAAILNLDDKVVRIFVLKFQLPAISSWSCQLQLSRAIGYFIGSIDGVNIACEKWKQPAQSVLCYCLSEEHSIPFDGTCKSWVGGSNQQYSFFISYLSCLPECKCNACFSPEEIKANLVAQLTGPVRWTQTIQNMIVDGATNFIEVGPGKVLQGLVKKINKDMEAVSAWYISFVMHSKVILHFVLINSPWPFWIQSWAGSWSSESTRLNSLWNILTKCSRIGLEKLNRQSLQSGD